MRFKRINTSKLIIGLLILIPLSACTIIKERTQIVSRQKKQRYCELKNFTAQSFNNKVYINWLVNSNVHNYYFLLERSTDGEHFTTIYIKKGHVSPLQNGLLYSYTDTDFHPAALKVYRLRAVPAVKNRDEQILYADSKNLFKDFENTLIKVGHNNSTVKK